MITEAELVVDRRRMKRRLTLWRIAAVLLAVVAIAALAWPSGGPRSFENHIARVRIDGLITGRPEDPRPPGRDRAVAPGPGVICGLTAPAAPRPVPKRSTNRSQAGQRTSPWLRSWIRSQRRAVYSPRSPPTASWRAATQSTVRSVSSSASPRSPSCSPRSHQDGRDQVG